MNVGDVVLDANGDIDTSKGTALPIVLHDNSLEENYIPTWRTSKQALTNSGYKFNASASTRSTATISTDTVNDALFAASLDISSYQLSLLNKNGDTISYVGFGSAAFENMTSIVSNGNLNLVTSDAVNEALNARANKVYYGSTTPSNPVVGDLWIGE